MAHEKIRMSASLVEDTKIYIKTVAVSGTPEPLFPERVYANRYLIQGLPSNTGAAYFMVEDPANPGTALPERFPISGLSNIASEGKNFDLSKVYIDVAVGGEGVIIKYNATGEVA